MAKRSDSGTWIPQPVHNGWPWFAAGCGVFALALLVLVLTGNTALQTSADGYGSTPLWAVLLPVGVGLVLVRALPIAVPAAVERRVHRALRGRPLGLEALVLLVCLAVLIAVGLVFGQGEGPADPEALIVPSAKVVLLLLVPLVMFWALRPGWRSDAPRLAAIAVRPGEWWRWGGAAAVVAVLYLAVFAPWQQALPAPEDLPPVQVTALAMLVTFLTASVLEELFFRMWLQTRLEILYGRWAGIVLAALSFAVLHIISHRAFGNAGLDLAAAVAVQGTWGILLGYLWARYRNFWLLIAAHGGINALPLLWVLLSP